MVLSSAIVCDRDRRIADGRRSMFPYDRKRSQTLLRSAICDLRSAIIWKPALTHPHLIKRKRLLSGQKQKKQKTKTEHCVNNFKSRTSSKDMLRLLHL